MNEDAHGHTDGRAEEQPAVQIGDEAGVQAGFLGDGTGFLTQEKDGKLGVAELVYGVLVSPTATLRRAAANPQLKAGLFIFALVSVLAALAGTLVAPQVFSELPAEYTDAWRQARPFFALFGVVFAAVALFVKAGVLRLIGELLGGRGSNRGVLMVLALVEVPNVLLVPVRVADFFLNESFWGQLLNGAGSLAVFIWIFVLLVVGVREAERFSTGRAVAVLLIPIGITVLLAVLFFVSLIGIMAPFLSGFLAPS